ncbi:MAG: hypothetical protein GXP63_02840 [DPANN group archaeon]|nr:hypothetical protein [DPANN group archaeon]
MKALKPCDGQQKDDRRIPHPSKKFRSIQKRAQNAPDQERKVPPPGKQGRGTLPNLFLA